MRRVQVASEVDNALSDGMSQGFCMLVGHKGGDATARHSDIARIDLRRSAQSAVRRAFGKLVREGHVVPLGSSKISPGRDWWDRRTSTGSWISARSLPAYRQREEANRQ
jgi:hypothetical protein